MSLWKVDPTYVGNNWSEEMLWEMMRAAKRNMDHRNNQEGQGPPPGMVSPQIKISTEDFLKKVGAKTGTVGG